MSQQDPFRPQGLSQLVAVTTAPSAALQLGIPGLPSVRIKTDADLFYAYGTSAGSSNIQCTVPTTSTPANGIDMVGPSVEVFGCGPGAWFSFATSSGTANARFVGGSGM